MDIEGVTLDDFSRLLTIQRPLPINADRPVIDKTGIRGRFNLYFDWPAGLQGGSASYGSFPVLRITGTSGSPVQFISAALEQQLGLRLEEGTGPGEFLVIDHIERRSSN